MTSREGAELDRWATRRGAFPEDRCVHQLFEAQAARTPGRPAVTCGDVTLTYAELDDRANRLAHRLVHAGIERESVVGIYLERSVDLVVGLLAVWKAGGAYVPLDPAYPPARLTHMIADAAIPLVLTQRTLVPSLRLPRATVALCLDEDPGDASAGGPPPVDHDAGQLAQVIYTSGSTGQPKGAEISHRSVVNLLWAFHLEPGFTADDVLLAITTFSFDIAELELCLPLISGGRVAIASREIALDARRLADEMVRTGTTVFFATPTTWRMLNESGWEGRPELTALCGGEALAPDLADQILRRVKVLWNLYGPTETTICSTMSRVVEGEPIRIGRPIPNTTARVLDEHLEVCPIGTAGELCLGGTGLARGYRGHPELNAERFIADPHAPGQRLYRTGDRVRWDSEGSLEYLGRLDSQVKIRGQRIELGEIEYCMTGIPGVASAVALVRKDSVGEPMLVGYVVPSPGAALASPSEMRAALRDILPPIMVPQAIVVMEAFPLTPNRKIDRQALPEPVLDPGDARPFEPPRTSLERIVAELFEVILSVPRIGRRDDFLELGGHSITAMRLINRLEALAGRRVPLARLLEQPTVTAIAAAIEEAPGSDAAPPPLTRQARLNVRKPRRPGESS